LDAFGHRESGKGSTTHHGANRGSTLDWEIRSQDTNQGGLGAGRIQKKKKTTQKGR